MIRMMKCSKVGGDGKSWQEKSDETEIPPASTAAAENCNEHNQNSSRIHFKFIINYRGFLLSKSTATTKTMNEVDTKEMENLCKFILRDIENVLSRL
jgi:hypothetical protein